MMEKQCRYSKEFDRPDQSRVGQWEIYATFSNIQSISQQGTPNMELHTFKQYGEMKLALQIDFIHCLNNCKVEHETAILKQTA